jgi:hypothetical protein
VSEQRLPYFGPPTRLPRPAANVPALRGKRVIPSTPEGFVYDMRAASETFRDADGKTCIDIVSEEHWYRWMFTPRNPIHESYPVHLVWVQP